MSEPTTCLVDINQNRMSLQCRKGLTLFAALRMHKIYLPTGCGARGLCGQCKVTLVDGEANPLTESEYKLLSDNERNQGVRLGCQVRVTNDLAVSLPEYVFHAGQYQAAITAIEPLTHDIRRFSFALLENGSLAHLAGQFLNLSVKIPGTNVQAIRCFSLATPAAVTDRADIIVKRNPKGVMTPYLFDNAREGDIVTLYGPFGDFHLRETDAPCIWIAGGSGLSPFLGMVEELIEKRSQRPVKLFFGAVKPNDLYYVDVLNDLMRQNPWFSFIPALSGDERSQYCKDYGLITEVVAKYIQDASDCEGYLCGSPGMIGACLTVLTERGMSLDKIYYDRF